MSRREWIRIITWNPQNIPRPLYNRELESKTDTQEGNLLFPRPLDREDHTIRPSLAEPAWDEDTPSAHDGNVSIVAIAGDRETEVVERT